MFMYHLYIIVLARHSIELLHSAVTRRRRVSPWLALAASPARRVGWCDPPSVAGGRSVFLVQTLVLLGEDGARCRARVYAARVRARRGVCYCGCV